MRINWKLGRDGSLQVNRRVQGSFTVFFSLILVVILLLYMVLFSMSRHFMSIVQGRRALDSAAAAVLAGFNEDLAGRYGLMGVENENLLLDNLQYFLQRNYQLDADILRAAANDGGIRYRLRQLEVESVHTLGEVEEFLSQMERFMAIRAPAAIIQELSSIWRNVGIAVSGGGILDEMRALQDRALVYNTQFAELVSWVDGVCDDGSRRSFYVKNFPGEGWDHGEILQALDALVSQWEDEGTIPSDTDGELTRWASRIKIYEEVHGKAHGAWLETIRLGRELADEILELKSRIDHMAPEEQASEIVRQVQNQMEEMETSLHQGSGGDEQITQALEQNMERLQKLENSLRELIGKLPEPPEDLTDRAVAVRRDVESLSRYQKEISLEYEVHDGKGKWSWKDIMKALNLYVVDLRQYAPNTVRLNEDDPRYQRLPSVGGGVYESGDQDEESLLLEPDNLAHTAEMIGGDLLRKVYLAVFTVGQLTNLEETVSREKGEFGGNLRGEKKEAGFFANEVEYVLNGSMNEFNNAWAAKGKLLFVRTVLNMLYLSTDAQKQQVIRSVADTAGGIIAPGIGNAVLYGAILLLWSTGEACADYNCLLEGGKVPLVKTAKDWKTDLETLLNKQLISESRGETDGLGYEQYLRLLLLWLDEEKWVLRLQDVIQLNIEKAAGKSFQMSSVVTEFHATGKMEADGREYEFAGYYGYE